LSRRKRRRGRSKIVPFPVRRARDAEDYEDWPPEVIAKWTERAREVRAYIDSGYLGIDALLDAQREMFETLALYVMNDPRRDGLIEALASRWAKLNALMERNREKAKALAAKRRRGDAPQGGGRC